MIFIVCIMVSMASDVKVHPPQVKKLEEYKDQLNQTQRQWDHIRLHFEYLSSPDDYPYIIAAMDVVKMFIETHLLVRRLENPIQCSRCTEIFFIPLPDDIEDRQFTADYLLFINFFSDSSDVIAQSGSNWFDKQTLRPIIGMIEFNVDQLEAMKTDFQQFVQTGIHELIHCLGFSKTYFDYFYDSASLEHYHLKPRNVFGEMQTPRLLHLAKQHFNCSALESVPLEDEGQVGTKTSHFERSLFYDEIMTGSMMATRMKITRFTFTLLEDTGFYRLMEHKADETKWGKNKGCDFVNYKCFANQQFEEFCYKDSDKCSFDYEGVGYCSPDDQLMNGCRYISTYKTFNCKSDQNKIYEDNIFYERYGDESICVEGSLSKNGKSMKNSCLQYKCDDQNLWVVVNNKEIKCQQNMVYPFSYIGHLKCPSYEAICKSEFKCRNGCSLKGLCLANECQCNSGYFGDSCQFKCQNYVYNQKCVLECPANTFKMENLKICKGCPNQCAQCDNYNKCQTCNKGYKLRQGFCDPEDLIFTKEDYYESQNKKKEKKDQSPIKPTQKLDDHKEIPSQDSKHTPQDIPTPKDIPKDVPKDIPKDVPKNIPKDVPIPQNSTIQNSSDDPKQIPQEVPKEKPQSQQSNPQFLPNITEVNSTNSSDATNSTIDDFSIFENLVSAFCCLMILI